MKKEKTNHLLEYTSLTLILSYFFIHNIFIVFIGITISLYFININLITKLVKNTNKMISSDKESRDSDDKYNGKVVINTSMQKKLANEDCKLTLVQTIEELGYIPSVNKNNAA
tara:strand:+ start:1581 stop:1919 length:339 start_codon:yes stop_codon:yes gene_type:complete